MVVLILTGLALLLAPPASAHVETVSGPVRVGMGWGNEPALSGSENFVDVELAGADGRPVRVPAGALTVEVAFGTSVRTLPLVPGEVPGAYRAPIVPTRPGTYAFHLTGTVRGRPVDVRATCSERTFDCVEDAAALQFPTREPSAGELAERADREIARAKRDAQDTADDARAFALVALVVALLALGAAVVVVVRSRRRT
jgi:hypothetical protein